MLWLEQLRLKRAARQYGRRLLRELWSRYGASPRYTVAQIQQAAAASGLDRRYIALGYAAFLPKEEYDTLASSMLAQMSYADARAMFNRFAVSPPSFSETGTDNYYPMN